MEEGVQAKQQQMFEALQYPTDLSQLVGTSVSLDQPRQASKTCQNLTQWIEVSPLELKLTIEDHTTVQPATVIDYDKENECCLCFCELYDDLKNLSLKEVSRMQMDIIIKKSSNQNAGVEVVKMGRCQGRHLFHKECLERQLESSSESANKFLKCAVCEVIYGKQVGDMPNGSMTWKSYPYEQSPLQGYSVFDCPNVIIIDYSIPSGTLSDGTRYHGTSRRAFLPGNQDGIKVLSMLAEAFRRRLTFKVGTSITTGQSNVVVWQGIHHKTSPSGGTSSFGYPDPTYMTRVTEELSGRGLTIDQLNGKLELLNGYIQLK
eukprot:403344134